MFRGPKQVVGLLPVRFVVHLPPHPTRVQVYTFRQLPYNLMWMISHLSLQEGDKEATHCLAIVQNAQKYPAFGYDQ